MCLNKEFIHHLNDMIKASKGLIKKHDHNI